MWMQTVANPTDFRTGRDRGLKHAWTAVWDRLTDRAILIVGLPIMGVLMIFTATNIGGQVVFWELAHTTVAGLLATVVAAGAARRTNGLERRLRGLVALGAASWTIG
ncbi:MAG: hypothetical protein QOI09_101, partial [Chloroflexota bacterium]|nr:hypothetical protein [Chloroflexota bacterium]